MGHKVNVDDRKGLLCPGSAISGPVTSGHFTSGVVSHILSLFHSTLKHILLGFTQFSLYIYY